MTNQFPKKDEKKMKNKYSDLVKAFNNSLKCKNSKEDVSTVQFTDGNKQYKFYIFTEEQLNFIGLDLHSK